MSTILVEDFEQLDFNNIKIGDQFISSEPGKKLLDTHISRICMRNINNNLITLVDTKVIYIDCYDTDIKMFYNQYFYINDKKIKIKDNSKKIMFDDIYSNKHIYTYVKLGLQKDKMLLKYNDNYIHYYCCIPINKGYLLITKTIIFDNTSIKQRISFTLIENKEIYNIDVDNTDEFLLFIKENINSKEFEIFESKVLEPSKYTIYDYLNGIPNNNFLSMFNSSNNVINYFNPIYEHNNFKVFLDYSAAGIKIISTINNKICNFLSIEYNRILKQLERYYINHHMLNPYTGELHCYNIVYEDAEGFIAESKNNEGDFIVITKLYNMYVHATNEESIQLMERYNLLNKLIT